jgi:hypothetical protein
MAVAQVSSPIFRKTGFDCYLNIVQPLSIKPEKQRNIFLPLGVCCIAMPLSPKRYCRRDTPYLICYLSISAPLFVKAKGYPYNQSSVFLSHDPTFAQTHPALSLQR